MKQKGFFVILVLIGGLFVMGMGFEDVYAPKKPKEIVVVGSKIVEGQSEREIPVEGAICTIEATNVQESTQIGKDRTNKQGKVTLIVKYEDPEGIVASIDILCAKEGLQTTTGRILFDEPGKAPEGEVKFKMSMSTN